MRLVVAAFFACVLGKEDPEMEFLNDILSEELPDGEQSAETASRRDFDEFDHNKDGQIDALEITARFGAQVNPIDMFYFFSHADKDASGTVSYPEYLDYVRFTSGEGDKTKTS